MCERYFLCFERFFLFRFFGFLPSFPFLCVACYIPGTTGTPLLTICILFLFCCVLGRARVACVCVRVLVWVSGDEKRAETAIEKKRVTSSGFCCAQLGPTCAVGSNHRRRHQRGGGAKQKKEYRKLWSHYSAPLGYKFTSSLFGFA